MAQPLQGNPIKPLVAGPINVSIRGGQPCINITMALQGEWRTDEVESQQMLEMAKTRLMSFLDVRLGDRGAISYEQFGAYALTIHATHESEEAIKAVISEMRQDPYLFKDAQLITARISPRERENDRER